MTETRRSLVLLVVSLLLLWIPAVFGSEVEDHYLKALALGKAQDTDGAIREYTTALAADPRYIKAITNRANCYRLLKQYPLALADLSRALAINPEFEIAINIRGATYQEMGDLDSALVDFQHAMRINPNHAYYHANVGNIYNDKEMWQQAVDEYTKSLQLDPTLEQVYTDRARIVMDKMFRPDLALDDFNKAIELDPKDSKAWYGRGNALLKLNRDNAAQAIGDYNKALELNPGDSAAINNRGIAIRYECEPRFMGRHTRSETPPSTPQSPEFQQTTPPNQNPITGQGPAPSDRHGRHRYENRDERTGRPVRYYVSGKQISKDEYDGITLEGKACDLISARKYDEALAILKTAETLAPNRSEIESNVGYALCKLGRSDEAIDHLKLAVKIDPRQSAPLSTLASTYQSDGKIAEAIDAYSLYLQRFPNENDVSFTRALLKELQDALRDQQQIQAGITGNSSQKNDYLLYVTKSGRVHWLAQPIKVYCAEGSTAKGYQPSYDKVLRDSFSEWSDGESGLVKFQFVKDKEKSDIDCYFTDDFSKVDSKAEGGEAQMQYEEHHFDHCTIVVLTVHGNSDEPPNENEIRSVCLHEIGHSLGLMGHSPDPNDILFFSVTNVDKRPKLTDRDLRTVKILYDTTEATK